MVEHDLAMVETGVRFPLPAPILKNFMSETSKKNKTVAILLAFFLGGLGIHKFYLGQMGWGIAYIVFCWTLIPSIAAFVEFIMLLLQSDSDFDKKYNEVAPVTVA